MGIVLNQCPSRNWFSEAVLLTSRFGNEYRMACDGFQLPFHQGVLHRGPIHLAFRVDVVAGMFRPLVENCSEPSASSGVTASI